ncbi:MAG: ABC transporter permease subunit [Candidatus Heimdallarchaeota archaeon]
MADKNSIKNETSLEFDSDTSKSKRKESFWIRLDTFWRNLNKDIKSVIYTILSIVIFLSVWEILCVTNILREPQIFRPTDIFAELWVLLTTNSAAFGNLGLHLLASFTRMLIAFLIAVILGLGIGLLMGWSKRVYEFLDPVVTFLMPIPGIAWAPLILVWIGFEPLFSRWGWVTSSGWWWDYGLGNPVLIIIGIIAGIFPIIQNISMAKRATDKKLIWAARTMGATEQMVFRKVLFPNSLPYLFTGLKLGLARCWRTIIATEFLSAAVVGLGWFIIGLSKTLETRETKLYVYAGIFVLSIVFYLIELGIKQIERQTIEKWGMVRKTEGGFE